MDVKLANDVNKIVKYSGRYFFWVYSIQVSLEPSSPCEGAAIPDYPQATAILVCL